MNTSDIIEEAKKRLAEIEAEAAKLRALIAAAEGKAPVVPFAPSPAFVYPTTSPVPVHVHYAAPPLDRVTCSTEYTIDTDSGRASTATALPPLLPIFVNKNGVAYLHGNRFDGTLVLGGEQRTNPNLRFTVS